MSPPHWLCHFVFIVTYIVFVSSYQYCSIPNSCTGMFLNETDYTAASGYKSAIGPSTSHSGGRIICTGSHSCSSMAWMEALTDYIWCDGTNSCSNTTMHINSSLLPGSTIYCRGSKSCSFATVTAKELRCYGYRSCANSHLYATAILGSGSFSLSGAIMDTINSTTSTPTITLRGRFAGYGAKLICRLGHTCSIRCEGTHSCTMLYIDCIGTCQFDALGFDELYGPTANLTAFMNRNTDISLYKLFGSEIMDPNTDILCVNESFAFDVDQERYDVPSIIGNSDGGGPICCRAQDACAYAQRIEYQLPTKSGNDVVCSGQQSCKAATMMHINQTVYCEAAEACRDSTFADASIVYCDGYYACAYADIANARDVVCRGYGACNLANFISGGSDLNVYFSAGYAGTDATIHCNRSDTCTVHCLDFWSCASTTLFCDGECVIHCDPSYVGSCPVVHTAIPTTDPSQAPTAYPSLTPSQTPSAYPSLNPTLGPTIQCLSTTQTCGGAVATALSPNCYIQTFDVSPCVTNRELKISQISIYYEYYISSPVTLDFKIELFIPSSLNALSNADPQNTFATAQTSISLTRTMITKRQKVTFSNLDIILGCEPHFAMFVYPLNCNGGADPWCQSTNALRELNLFLCSRSRQQETLSAFEYTVSPDLATIDITSPSPSWDNYRIEMDIIYENTILCTPTKTPTSEPTKPPTKFPTESPTDPTKTPSEYPTKHPTIQPTFHPTVGPTVYPTPDPSKAPSEYPTRYPTTQPTAGPTLYPTFNPTSSPTTDPVVVPTLLAANTPTISQLSTNTPMQLSTMETTRLMEEKEEKPTRNDNTTVIIIISLLLLLILALGIGIWRRWKQKKKILVVATENMTTGSGDTDAKSDTEQTEDHQPKAEAGTNTVEMNKTLVTLQETKAPAIRMEDETNESSEDMYINHPDEEMDHVTATGGAEQDDVVPQHVYAEQIRAEELCAETKGAMDTAGHTKDGEAENDGEATDEEGEINEVKDWLDKKVEMMEYYQCFVNNGFTSLELIKNIKDISDLQNIGIVKIEHQYAIIHHINQLRK